MYGAAAKYMKKSKTFISKWIKCYSDVDDLLDCDSVQKTMKKGEQSEENRFYGCLKRISSIG